MKKINLGLTISILANVGVIFGIGFLAVEIQQSTLVQESQMRFSQSERQTEVIEEVMRNQELRTALTKRENGELLTQDQDRVLEYFALRVFLSFQWIYGEVRREAMPSDVLERLHAGYRTGPGLSSNDKSFYSDYWARAEKSRFDAEFIGWMDAGLPIEGDD